MIKALLIDHNDSFTLNVKSWLSAQFNIEILNVDQLSENHFDLKFIKKYSLIILSPGPHSPPDYVQSLKFTNFLIQNKIPILGICLGLQILTYHFGGKIKAYNPPIHGKATALSVNLSEALTSSTVLKNINDLKVARYHSLYCDITEIKNSAQLLAQSDNLAMIVFFPEARCLGFQFHPESFLTEKSENYLKLIEEYLL